MPGDNPNGVHDKNFAVRLVRHEADLATTYTDGLTYDAAFQTACRMVDAFSALDDSYTVQVVDVVEQTAVDEFWVEAGEHSAQFPI